MDAVTAKTESYNGYLAAYIETVRTMHADGKTSRQIAEVLYASGVRADTSEPGPRARAKMSREHHINNLRQMVSYAMLRMGMGAPPRVVRRSCGRWTDGLCVRACNALRDAAEIDGPPHVHDEVEIARLAAKRPLGWWKALPNFGRRSYGELRQWLSLHGHDLPSW